MSKPAKKPEAHSSLLPLKRRGCFIFKAGGPSDRYSTNDALCECSTNEFAEFLVRRVNSGPEVDRKLQLAHDLTSNVVGLAILAESGGHDLPLPDEWEVVVELAREYQSMQETR